MLLGNLMSPQVDTQSVPSPLGFISGRTPQFALQPQLCTAGPFPLVYSHNCTEGFICIHTSLYFLGLVPISGSSGTQVKHVLKHWLQFLLSVLSLSSLSFVWEAGPPERLELTPEAGRRPGQGWRPSGHLRVTHGAGKGHSSPCPPGFLPQHPLLHSLEHMSPRPLYMTHPGPAPGPTHRGPSSCTTQL